MKKILLTAIILLISASVFAQKEYDIEKAEKTAKAFQASGLVSSYEGRRMYYDYRSNQFLMKEQFADKYGQKTVELLDRLHSKGLLWDVNSKKNYDIKEAEEIANTNRAPGLVTSYKGRRVYYDYQSNQFLMEEHFAKKYGMSTVKALDQMYLKGKLFEAPIAEPSVKQTKPKLYIDEGIDYEGKKYRLKMNPRNLVAGTAVIGASAAAYMLTSSITGSRAKKLGKDLAKGDISLDDFTKKVESMDKLNETMGYICAGTSLVGVIVVLTGLHKEYAQGINLGHNFTVSDYGAGISLTKKF